MRSILSSVAELLLVILLPVRTRSGYNDRPPSTPVPKPAAPPPKP